LIAVEYEVPVWDVMSAVDAAFDMIKAKRHAGAYGRNLFGGSGKPETRQVIGAIGEMAVCNWLGVPFDRRPMFNVNRPDLIWQGWKLEVKTTSYKVGRLAIPADQPPQGEVYVLVMGVRPEIVDQVVTFAGWTLAEELFEPRRQCEWNGRRNYVMVDEELRHMDELRDLERKWYA
jgi:hypothetical protein